MIKFLDLYRLYAQQEGDSWVVGDRASFDLRMARDKSDMYITNPVPTQPTLYGLLVRLDSTMPPGRIELRYGARVVGVIEDLLCSP